MEKINIFLIVLGIIIALSIGGYALLSSFKLETYSVHVDVEGVNSYPPRLTQLVYRGSELDSTLSSITPKGEALANPNDNTYMEGIIRLTCKDYSDTQEWRDSSNTYGVELLSKHTFKGVPADTYCTAEATTTICTTNIETGACSKLTKYVSFTTPKEE